MSRRISVVMAVYNGERYLEGQLRSVLEQMTPDDELVIVDDASADRSMEIILAAQSGIVRVVRNELNIGVLKSFERGLELARHEFIFLCDQDDLWLPGKRTAFLAAFNTDPRATVVISDAEVIDAHGTMTSSSFMATRRGFSGTLWGTMWRNRFLGCSMAIRRHVLDVALPIPPGVPMHDMWLGSIGGLVGHVIYLPVPYLQYRRHVANVTPAIHQSWQQMLEWRGALLSAVVLRVARFGLKQLRRNARTRYP